MDWARAIDINRAVLLRIIATLVAMIEAQGGVALVPVPVHRAMVRLLRPAESAVRRLILIAARKVVVMPALQKPVAVREWPDGLVIARATERKRRAAFRLFDPIRQFGGIRDGAPGPGLAKFPVIRTIGLDPRIPAFLRGEAPKPPSLPAGFISVQKISSRIAAVSHAVNNIPREAKRLMRLLGKSAPDKRKPVLRPGPPPGGVKKPRDEIHLVLKECHALARHALSDSS